ncbi:MAG: DNA mismatch repair protein MutS [Thermoanaerobaculia bacterium]
MRPGVELTPMLRHYMELKSQFPDAVLFYRMGDFYELFFEDALRVAPLLDLTLTARQKGSPNEAPMCGVPHHAVAGYIGKLIRLGLKVAVCDQVEDPAQAKGLVRREVTRVVTPGTVSESSLLESKEENLLAGLFWQGTAGAGAFLDVSTGSFFLRRWRDPLEAVAELEVLRPKELLLDSSAVPESLRLWAERDVVCRSAIENLLESPAKATDRLLRQFGVGTLRGFGLEEGEAGVRAAAAVLSYAQSTQRSKLDHVTSIALRSPTDHLVLDATTLANLEVLRTQRDPERGASLLSVVDLTVTAVGGRLLRDWLRRPLKELGAIADRHDAVAALSAEPARLARLRTGLARIADLERLATRAVVGSLSPREAAAVRDSLAELPLLFSELAALPSRLLVSASGTDPAVDLAVMLRQRLDEEPAGNLDDGRVIASGVDAELDEYRSLASDAKRHILELEERERKRTGISSLKVRYNRVFGYSIEITRANQNAVPADYIRRQTLANAERYVTPEVQALEERILHAEDRRSTIEKRIYQELVVEVASQSLRLQRLGQAVGAVDVLAAFADLAMRRNYVRPEMLAPGSGVRIEEGRHPVLDAALGESFVPNDLELDPERSQIVLLTGPNMGGKSTYLRQSGLLVLLAQAGSFIPARRAAIGVVDRIFSRVGASDDLARGESTFMVEMIETSNILRFATPESLVVLDEVGRGTATFDGLSLAWAIVEHLHERVRPLTLFATHYHELTELADLLPRVVNRTMAVKEWEDRIVFLRRVMPGSADKSYGIHVAKLAGLPESVTARAQQVLANLEAKEIDPEGRPRLARGEMPADRKTAQLPLFTPAEEIVASIVRDLDVERLSPLAALNLLASLKDRLR